MKQNQNKGAVIKGLAFPIGYTVFMNAMQIGLILVIMGICLSRALLALLAVPAMGIDTYVEQYMLDYTNLLNNNTWFLSVLSTITALLILWFVFNRKEKRFTEYFRFTPASWRALLTAALLGLSLFFLTNAVMTVLEQALFMLLDWALMLLESSGYDITPIVDYINALLEAMSSMYDGVGMFTVAAILGAPLIEELVFRAGPLKHLTKKMPAFAAVMLTAALFALAHGNPLQMIYTFALGVVSAYLFLKTDSIYPSILCHFVFNGANMIALFMQGIFRTDLWVDSPYYTDICAKFETWSAITYWIYLGVTFLLAIPMLIVGIRMLVKLRLPEKKTPAAEAAEIEQILYTDDAQLVMAAPSLAEQAENSESPEPTEPVGANRSAEPNFESPETVESTESVGAIHESPEPAQNSEAQA